MANEMGRTGKCNAIPANAFSLSLTLPSISSLRFFLELINIENPIHKWQNISSASLRIQMLKSETTRDRIDWFSELLRNLCISLSFNLHDNQSLSLHFPESGSMAQHDSSVEIRYMQYLDNVKVQLCITDNFRFGNWRSFDVNTNAAHI